MRDIHTVLRVVRRSAIHFDSLLLLLTRSNACAQWKLLHQLWAQHIMRSIHSAKSTALVSCAQPNCHAHTLIVLSPYPALPCPLPYTLCTSTHPAVQVGPKVPRIVVNREVIKGASGREFKYNFDMCPEEGRRDGIFLGDCDDFAEQLAGELGWYDDLQKFVKANKRQAAAEEQAAKQKAAKKEQAAKRKAAAGDDTAGLKCCGLF